MFMGTSPLHMRPCKINLKIFCAPALKKEVGALLWQNGNETCFRETELAFLIRLFTGYLQLYPTHTKLLLALQRLRDTARAHSLLKDVFSFSIITQRPGLFSAPGVFAPSPQGDGECRGTVTPAAPAVGYPPRRRARRSAGRQTRPALRAWTRR